MQILVIWASLPAVTELTKRLIEHQLDFEIRFASGTGYVTVKQISWKMLELWVIEIRKTLKIDAFPEMVSHD